MIVESNILKQQWERRYHPVEVGNKSLKMLLKKYIKAEIDTISFLANGCGNSNYKITFYQHPPMVLRFYAREAVALKRELNIYALLQNTKIPIPNIEYYDDSCRQVAYPFAIMPFFEGVLLRDLIFSGEQEAIIQTVYSAGQYLGILQTMKFTQAGFLHENLQVIPFSEDENYVQILTILVQDAALVSILGQQLASQLQQLVLDNQALLLCLKEISLTHADYDASNILVKKVKEEWKISGILDWEFSFAGHYLFDVAIFLRFSHKLPPYFIESFIAGMQQNGICLPKDWQKTAKLLDIINMLTILQAKQPAAIQQEKVIADIISLLQHTVEYWQNF